VRTPLREPTPTNSLQYLKSIFPKNSVVDTFLFFGGTLEFALAQSDHIVRTHTNRYVIYEFWHCIREDPERVIQLINHFHERRHEVTTQLLQERWWSLKDQYVRAAMFFLLSAYSSNAQPSSGKLNFQNFNPVMLNRLRTCSFENLRINFYTDEDFLSGIDYLEGGEFLVLPIGKYSYNLFEDGKSYGPEETVISHVETKLKIDQYDGKAIVIYKPHKEVFKLYENYNITMLDKYGRQCEQYRTCEELIIANF